MNRIEQLYNQEDGLVMHKNGGGEKKIIQTNGSSIASERVQWVEQPKNWNKNQ